MATITGVVDAITEKNTQKGTIYNVSIGGKEYATFKDEAIDGLEEGMTVKADVGSKKNGNYTNYYFNSWEEANGHGASTNSRISKPFSQGTAPSAEVFEARDRRIAMESAYGTAAQMLQALATAGKTDTVSSENLTILAHKIYGDVQRAGNDFKDE